MDKKRICIFRSKLLPKTKLILISNSLITENYCNLSFIKLPEDTYGNSALQMGVLVAFLKLGSTLFPACTGYPDVFQEYTFQSPSLRTRFTCTGVPRSAGSSSLGHSDLPML